MLIRRRVPEWEQQMLWDHTRDLRMRRMEQREVERREVERREVEKHKEKVVIKVKDRHHRRRSADERLEFVRKRTRSKSPSVLLYLAGGRP